MRLVSQRSSGGGGGDWVGAVRLHLAGQQGDVIHQKQAIAAVTCWKDIQCLSLWEQEGAKEARATFFAESSCAGISP